MYVLHDTRGLRPQPLQFNVNIATGARGPSSLSLRLAFTLTVSAADIRQTQWNGDICDKKREGEGKFRINYVVSISSLYKPIDYKRNPQNKRPPSTRTEHIKSTLCVSMLSVSLKLDSTTLLYTFIISRNYTCAHCVFMSLYSLPHHLIPVCPILFY